MCILIAHPHQPCLPAVPCQFTHQVATDTRLWLYAQLQEIRASLQELIAVATNRAEAEADVLMPGGWASRVADARVCPAAAVHVAALSMTP
jgi:argininosuccinate lyase